MSINTQNKAALYSDLGFPFRGFTQIGIGTSGAEDGESPGAGKTLTYGTNPAYLPQAVVSEVTPPDGLPSKTVDFYDDNAVKNLFLQARENARQITLHERVHDGVTLDNPNGWVKITSWLRGDIGNITLGTRVTREFSGAGVVNSAIVNFDEVYEYLRPTLSSTSRPADDVDCTDAVIVSDVLTSIFYPGPNQIAFAAQTFVATNPANVLASSTGGSSWGAFATPPFAADESVSAVAYKVLSDRQLQVVFGNGTAGAGNAQIANYILDFNDLLSGTPTVVTLNEGSVGDTIQALGWKWFNELLIAAEGKIYVSTDQGATVEPTLTPAATTQINKIFYTPTTPQLSQVAYFVGESNTLYSKEENVNSISTLVGPLAAASLKAGAVSTTGILYVGAGGSLYRSLDGGTSAGGWSLVRDFGGADVVGVRCVRGDAQMLEVVLADGSVFVSADGVSFETVPALVGSTYNGVAASESETNRMICYGPSNTTAPTIDLLSA